MSTDNEKKKKKDKRHDLQLLWAVVCCICMCLLVGFILHVYSLLVLGTSKKKKQGKKLNTSISIVE
jgi:hypothetical protein